jgi:hypothetical protein
VRRTFESCRAHCRLAGNSARLTHKPPTDGRPSLTLEDATERYGTCTYGPGTDLERTPDDASGRTVTAMSARRWQQSRHAGHEHDHPELGDHSTV